MFSNLSIPQILGFFLWKVGVGESANSVGTLESAVWELCILLLLLLVVSTCEFSHCEYLKECNFRSLRGRSIYKFLIITLMLLMARRIMYVQVQFSAIFSENWWLIYPDAVYINWYVCFPVNVGHIATEYRMCASFLRWHVFIFVFALEAAFRFLHSDCWLMPMEGNTTRTKFNTDLFN
jgi:hypothetical protein